MFKKGFLSLILLLSTFSVFGTSLSIKYDVPSVLEKGINSCVQETLDLVLSPYLIIDDDNSDIFYLTVTANEYVKEDNTLVLNFVSKYNDESVIFDIKIIEAKTENAIFNNLSNKLLYALKYDIENLFEKNDGLKIDYYNSSLASFNFGKENKLSEAQYFYIRNKANEIVGVANINTLFETDATLNIISNKELTPNLRLTDGPSGLLSANFSYDFYDKYFFPSIGYTFYDSVIPFLTNANLILECGAALNSFDSVQAVYFDAGLSLELPLSLLFGSEGFFKNSDIRVTALGGGAYKDGIHFNSKYTIGYGIYLSNKYNLELYYEKNTIFTSLADSSFILGMRVSVLL